MKGFLSTQVDGKRTPITSNDLIEQQLERHGIICVENLVHEIKTVGRNFRYGCFRFWVVSRQW